jgi:hypothetical protein
MLQFLSQVLQLTVYQQSLKIRHISHFTILSHGLPLTIALSQELQNVNGKIFNVANLSSFIVANRDKFYSSVS